MKPIDVLAGGVIKSLGLLPWAARPAVARSLQALLRLAYARSPMNGMIEAMIVRTLGVTTEQADRIARDNFHHMAMTLLESMGLGKLKREWDGRVEIYGLEYLRDALAEGRGAVLVSAHLGNYELIVRGLPLTGLPLTTIGWKQPNAYHFRYLDRLRQIHGTKLVYSQEARTEDVVAILRAGGVLILAGDYYPRQGRNVLPFFGIRTSVPAGALHYSIQAGAPLIPIYTLREKFGYHRVHLEPPLNLPTQGDLYQATLELCVATFERWIRAHPEQYLWAIRHTDWGRMDGKSGVNMSRR